MKLSLEQKKSRSRARTQIIKMVNKHRQGTNARRLGLVPFSLPPFNRRQINEAVFFVRQNKLLPRQVLESAGFNGR